MCQICIHVGLHLCTTDGINNPPPHSVTAPWHFGKWTSIKKRYTNFENMIVSVYIASSSGTTKDGFSGQFFRIFEIIIFCFAVDILDLMHGVKALYYLNFKKYE